MNINSAIHYDHIVPLAQGGINDVTNIQLLCDKCNLKKTSKNVFTTLKYESWY
jgi:5-methylcytosine-specific restriction endonuclease McrA